MKKKKILFLIDDLGGGGAEKVLSTIVCNVDRTRFDLTVCTIVGGGDFADIVSQNANLFSVLKQPESYKGVMKIWYSFKYHLIYHWLPLWLVYWLFLPHGNDVEVAYVEGFATKLLAHSTNKQAKKLAWVHCNLEKDHWTKAFYKNDDEEKWCYQQFDRIITVSQTQKQAMQSVFGDLPIQVCYNPINSDQILTLSREVIPFTKEDGVFRIVSAGRLQKVKGFDRLIRIVKRLIVDGYKIECWLIGAGSEKNELLRIVSENGLIDSVQFLGFHSNPYKYMSRCDLFVCSSLSEGFSTAITEALILGLPVVTTEVSGVHEQLEFSGSKCGIITANDEEALFVGIHQILSDKSLYIQLKRNAELRGKDFQLRELMNGIEQVLVQ